jgi:hypothetical protein
MPTGPRYSPLDTREIGKSVVDALLDRPAEALGGIGNFVGAGIYVIYYVGEFRPYRMIVEKNRHDRFSRPIYIGKAVPAGARTGVVLAEEYTGTALYKRLKEHADSIRATSTLDIDDFFARYLVVDDVWIPLAESLLISRYAPIWNLSVPGFGNHNPGKGRYQGMVSRWDTLHPGRSWAVKFQPRLETADQIANEVEAQLRHAADLTQLALKSNGNVENGSSPDNKSETR